MEIDRRELKRQAREAMKLPVPRFWLVTLIYLLATTGVSMAAEYIPMGDAQSGLGFTSLFLSILISLYTMVVRFGFQLWSLWTHRRLDPGLGSLMQGFSVSGRVILMEIQIFLCTMGWSLVLSIAAGVPMGLMLLFAGDLPFLFIILMLFWAGVVIIASTLIRLRYCMAPFFLADCPEDGSTAAVRRSVDMTKGWKWELFKLEVSFWGWDILNFLLSLLVLVPFLAAHVSLLFSLDLNTVNGTLQTIQQVIYDPLPYILSTLVAVPLSLWLEPYRCVSRAGFYDARLQIQQESAPEL